MNKNINHNTPLSELTVGDLLSIFENYKQNKYEKKYAYGIKGLAETLGCSIAQANRIKAAGKLNGVIMQEKKGNGITIDIKKAQTLYNQNFKK
jgi:hypothetical protein